MKLETIVILAGGLGTRLQPISNGLPKCLTPLLGHPFLHFKLMQVSHWGMQNVVLALGHGGHLVEEYIRTTSDRRLWGDIRISCIHDGGTLRGTGGALSLVTSQLQDEVFFVTFGDNLLQISNDDILKMEMASDKNICMTVNSSSFSLSRPNITLIDKEYALYGERQSATHVDYGLFSMQKKLIGNEGFRNFLLSDWLREYSEQNAINYLLINHPFYEINDKNGLSKTRRFLEGRNEFSNSVS